jgi:hypothetical protein
VEERHVLVALGQHGFDDRLHHVLRHAHVQVEVTERDLGLDHPAKQINNKANKQQLHRIKN